MPWPARALGDGGGPTHHRGDEVSRATHLAFTGPCTCIPSGQMRRSSHQRRPDGWMTNTASDAAQYLTPGRGSHLSEGDALPGGTSQQGEVVLQLSIEVFRS